jgi:hypothetical protein
MRPQPVLASVLAKAALAGVVSQPGRALAKSNECGFITAAAIRGTEMKVVYRILPLIAPAVAVGASVALGEPSASAFSYAASGACLASPEGFNSKLEPNNSGVAWTTTFTFSGNSDSHGNATEFGQAIDSASFGVGPRMHKPAAYAYQFSFSSSFRFVDEDKSDRFYIGSASGKFVTGPNAGIAFKVSDIELGKGSFGSGFTVYGSAGSPLIQTVSLGNGVKFQRIRAVIVRIDR